jgi:hypothetical protein
MKLINTCAVMIIFFLYIKQELTWYITFSCSHNHMDRHAMNSTVSTHLSYGNKNLNHNGLHFETC